MGWSTDHCLPLCLAPSCPAGWSFFKGQSLPMGVLREDVTGDVFVQQQEARFGLCQVVGVVMEIVPLHGSQVTGKSQVLRSAKLSKVQQSSSRCWQPFPSCSHPCNGHSPAKLVCKAYETLILMSWQAYFTWWVVLALVWSLVATVLSTLMPILESWRLVTMIASSLLPCIPGLKPLAQRLRQEQAERESEAAPPVKTVEFPAASSG